MLSAYISMVDTPTEKELIAQLYNAYKQFMYNISMSLLGNKEDAEDAVQDSFVRIIKNLDKIQNPYSRKTKSYITIITKNICFDRIKKQQNMQKVCLDEKIFEDDLAQQAEVDITYEKIIKNMKLLSPQLKNIAFLYYVQQLPTDDIAEMLDIEPNTAHVYLSRIRKTLLMQKD